MVLRVVHGYGTVCIVIVILVSKYGPVSFFLDETVRARTERTYVLLTF